MLNTYVTFLRPFASFVFLPRKRCCIV